MESTMEERPPPPAIEGAGKASGPTSTASAERDEEKGGALDNVAPLSPGVHDEAETDVKAAVAAPEERAMKKGKTALIMVAICVRDD